MRRGTWAEDLSMLMDAADNGVLTRKELREAGVADGTVARRCASGGPWQHLLPGVVLLHNGHPSHRQRLAAALAYGGEQSMLTGSAGLGVHGLGPNPPLNEIHILVPHDIQRASVKFVRSERTYRMPDPADNRNPRCAPVVRCLVDATRAIRDKSQCTALIAEVIRRGRVSLEELAIELAEGPRRYSASTRQAVADLDGNAHSVAEADAQRLYRSSGLPPMIHNARLFAADGTFLGSPDGFVDPVCLGWEIDSLAHHLSPIDHANTMVRRALMQRHGVIVVSHLPQDIRDDPRRVLADLRAGYEQALARPRPNLLLRQELPSIG
ncbi:hypothetical protein [Rhodococcoides yunnanense]|uniref:Uncharacterized protein n=1 Tax=Rhodococcoides yunnanense TaxID=278209 RepID=A0ABU4B9L8_9NOCA|nr:hypothetical protein [Rhodococcus yunnanensis]MDV6260887.1 hypothetical protein [Rhodococcus yunnanensis]